MNKAQRFAIFITAYNSSQKAMLDKPREHTTYYQVFLSWTNFQKTFMFKSHEKFRLVVNLFVVIAVFRDQKSNVLRCTPAATMHRDSFVFDYWYNFLIAFGAASNNNNTNINNNDNNHYDDNDNDS